MLPPVWPPVLSPPVTVTKLLLPQRAEASVASSHGASRMPSSCKHVWSRTRSVVSVQEQGRHHRCGLARGRRSPGCLPPKWCPQTPYPRPSTAPAVRKRPAKTSSRRQPKPRQAWEKPPAIQIENAGCSGSLGCQRSRGRALCVLCTPTCGMTTSERVSKGGERARVAV